MNAIENLREMGSPVANEVNEDPLPPDGGPAKVINTPMPDKKSATSQINAEQVNNDPASNNVSSQNMQWKMQNQNYHDGNQNYNYGFESPHGDSVKKLYNMQSPSPAF